MKEIHVQLALKTNFLADSRYPKTQFRVPDPSLIGRLRGNLLFFEKGQLNFQCLIKYLYIFCEI